MFTSSAGLGRYPGLLAAIREAAAHHHLALDELTLARVLAQHRGHWLVQRAACSEDLATALPSPPELAICRGKLRDDPAGAPVTGDWGLLDAAGAIAAILTRRGTITRRAAGVATRPQLLAAGVDLALITEPLDAVRERRAGRLAALAAAGGVAAVVVITKCDAASGGEQLAAGLAADLGLPGVAVSSATGDGLGALQALLAPGTTAVLLGPSGAGKSTLANALLGQDQQATGAVRDHDRRGRHTTVTRELLPLPGGALLIDTPGLREVGLWDAPPPAGTAAPRASHGGTDAGEQHATSLGVAAIDRLASSCRFSDCQHHGEPGCAVREVVSGDDLAAWRKLQREQAWVEDRRSAARQRAQLGRQYRSVQRSARRQKGGG